MRGDPGRAVKWLPTKDIIEAARVASEKLLRQVLQLCSKARCFIWSIRIINRNFTWVIVVVDTYINWKLIHCEIRCRRPGAGSDGPLETCTMIKKRNKGKAPNRSGLRDAAMKHLEYRKSATRYPLAAATFA